MRRITTFLPWVCLALVLTYVAVHWATRVVPAAVGPKQAGQARAFMDFDVYMNAARQIRAGASV